MLENVSLGVCRSHYTLEDIISNSSEFCDDVYAQFDLLSGSIQETLRPENI